jgi:tRNA A-37 threonylcarbamoyl transferase component Bud32
MAEQDDIAVGRKALEKGIVPREKLVDCIFEIVAERKGERARSWPRPLGVMLLQRGLLTQAQLTDMLMERFTPAAPGGSLSDLPLGELLIGLGHAKREHIVESLAIQKTSRSSSGPRTRLGEILVGRGIVTGEQVVRALAYQGKEMHRCTRCAVRVNLANVSSDARPACQFCGGLLVPAESGSIGVHDSDILPTAPVERQVTNLADSTLEESSGAALQAVDMQQHEIDRAVEMYLRQNGMARRESLREVRRVQVEIGRYGLAVPLLDVLRRTNALTQPQQEALAKVDFAAVVKGKDWQEQEVPGYRLQAKIAMGGYATIYTAQPMFGQQTIALKVLRPERADEHSKARLKHEAALLRALDHPGIIKGMEYGHSRGTHYITMEYFAGVSLGQAIAESRGFAPRLALTITRQIAEALEYLKREGYIHRDVKPDNVIVDNHYRTKLCDLGFATKVGIDAKATARLGTVGYASPEQARGVGDLDVRSDIYALGLTLYSMLAGFEPFSGASSEVMVAEFVEGGLPPPDLLKIKADPPVIELIRRMTVPEAAKRLASYAELHKQLDAMLA